FRAGEHDGLAAELAHADIEGNARARGGLFEHHGQRLAGERALGFGAGLQAQLARARIIKDAAQIVAGNARKIGEMPECVHDAAFFASVRTAAAAWMRATASRISSSLTVRGGGRRMTLSPAGTTSSFSSRSAAVTAVFGTLHLSPSRRPAPRTSSKSSGNSSTTEARDCLARS